MRQISTQNELKLYILRGAIALCGRKPDEVVQSEFCKKMAYQLGVTTDDLKMFSAQGYSFVGSSDPDTLHLINFIADVRNEIINPKAKDNSNVAIGTNEDLKDATHELDKIFAIFQLALGATDPDECTKGHYHLPAFVVLINTLCGFKNEPKTQVPVNKQEEEQELEDLAGLLEITAEKLATISDTELKNLFKKACYKYHPDKVGEKEKSAAEEKFKQLSALYTKFADSRPQVVSREGIKMPSGIQISATWIKIYDEMRCVRSDKHKKFDRTYWIYNGFLNQENSIDSITQKIERCTKALADKVWYHNKFMLGLTFVNIVSMSAVIIYPQNTSMLGAVKLVMDRAQPYGKVFGIEALLFAGFVAVHKFGEEKYEVCRFMDTLGFIMTSVTAIMIGSLGSMTIMQGLIYGKTIDFAPKILGLDVVINAAAICAMYKISQHYNNMSKLEDQTVDGNSL